MEKQYEVLGTIPCKIVEPAAAPQRIVLGVHGLGGSMEDEIQQGIAEEMTLFGAVSVRFDFPCHGQHPSGGVLDLDECTDTLVAVAQDACEKYPQVNPLCIFASGFGAYVTLLALPRLQQLPKQLRLVVQTPNVCMHATLLSMLKISRETLRAMDRYTLKLHRPFDVSYGLYEQMLNNVALTTYDMPMLILHGEADDFINMADIRAFRSVNDQAKLVIIPGTSHRFLEEGAWDMVLDLTRDWFSCQQVLVADWE